MSPREYALKNCTNISFLRKQRDYKIRQKKIESAPSEALLIQHFQNFAAGTSGDKVYF